LLALAKGKARRRAAEIAGDFLARSSVSSMPCRAGKLLFLLLARLVLGLQKVGHTVALFGLGFGGRWIGNLWRGDPVALLLLLNCCVASNS